METSWETHLTRPDLSCAVSLVSQFMQNPKVPHKNATLRILRYLRKDPDIGLVQKKCDKGQILNIHCFADADGQAQLLIGDQPQDIISA